MIDQSAVLFPPDDEQALEKAVDDAMADNASALEVLNAALHKLYDLGYSIMEKS